MRRLKSTTWTLKSFANATLPPFPSPDRRPQNNPSILILCLTFARGCLPLPALSCLPSAPWLRCPVISMLHVSKHGATPPIGTTALRATACTGLPQDIPPRVHPSRIVSMSCCLSCSRGSQTPPFAHLAWLPVRPWAVHGCHRRAAPWSLYPLSELKR